MNVHELLELSRIRNFSNSQISFQVYLEMLLCTYDMVVQNLKAHESAQDAALMWTMARLNYLENRAFLYHMSGTIPPTSSAPVDVCGRFCSLRFPPASVPAIDPQTLYNLDYHFNVLKSTD